MDNQRKNNHITADRLAFFVCFLYGLAASLVSIHRFWQYESFYYDFGIFDHALWLFSRAQMPIIDHLALGRVPIFADHFSPTIFLLSPIYWITSRSEILFIVQALSVTASGFVLYQIGKKILDHVWLAGTIMISYLSFVGLQNALITDFHEVTIATLPLMLTFWAYVSNKRALYWLFFIMTLGCKESMFAAGIGIGLFLITTSLISSIRNKTNNTGKKQWITTGIWTILISIFYGLFIINIVIPFFSHGVYIYTPQLPNNDPLLFFTRFFDDPIKRHTLRYSFQSFLFLPLFSPIMWPLLLQDLFIRFIPYNTGGRWTLGMHYNALTSVYLAIGSLYGLQILKYLIHRFYAWKPTIRLSVKHILIALSVVLCLNALYIHQRVLHGPLGLAYNSAFYRHSYNFGFLDDFVSLVPKNASVMTQNHLAVRFTHQELFLPDMKYTLYKPDYIVLDLRPEQNPNDFFGYHGKDFSTFTDAVLNDSLYEKIFENNHQFILKRKK